MRKKQKNVLQIVTKSWGCIVRIITIWFSRQTANGWIIPTTNLNIIFRLFSQAFTQGFSDLSEGALRDYNDAMVSHSTIQWSLFSVQLLINRWSNVLLPELETMTSWKWIWMMKRLYGMFRHCKKKSYFLWFLLLIWITFVFKARPVLPVSESGRRVPCRRWRCCCWKNFISTYRAGLKCASFDDETTFHHFPQCLQIQDDEQDMFASSDEEMPPPPARVGIELPERLKRYEDWNQTGST